MRKCEDKSETIAQPLYKTYEAYTKDSVCYPKGDAELLKHVLEK